MKNQIRSWTICCYWRKPHYGGRYLMFLCSECGRSARVLATTPYASFHFHRLAPYGVLANLLAMPVVSIWVMPAGLLALV